MSTTFELACVGDRVWSVLDGWGVIKSVRGGCTYGVRVYFGDATKAVNKSRVKEFSQSYTKCGKLHYEDLNPILFWDEIVFEVPKKPLPDLEVDARVLVWNSENPEVKFPRHFSHFVYVDGKVTIYAYDGGGTSFTTKTKRSWSGYEVIEE